MAKILVVDACSLIAFFRYYSFDRDNSAIIYNKLKDFLIKKIIDGEIIVIDKVFEEVKEWEIFVKDFKAKIKDKVVDTTPLIAQVKQISNDFYLEANESVLNNDSARINQEITDYENVNADAFLVAKCMSLKGAGQNPILITEETKKTSTKLFSKIPFICKKRNIECNSMPYSLFELYKEQLKFALDVK